MDRLPPSAAIHGSEKNYPHFYPQLVFPVAIFNNLQSREAPLRRRRFNSVPGHHHSKEVSSFISCFSSPPAVRTRDRLPSRLLFMLDSEELSSDGVVSQSAPSPFLSGAWLRIAVNISPAATMRSRLTAWV